MRLERYSFLPLNLIKKMHVYDKIFVSMPTCMIEIENGEDEGIFLRFSNCLFPFKISITSSDFKMEFGDS